MLTLLHIFTLLASLRSSSKKSAFSMISTKRISLNTGMPPKSNKKARCKIDRAQEAKTPHIWFYELKKLRNTAPPGFLLKITLFRFHIRFNIYLFFLTASSLLSICSVRERTEQDGSMETRATTVLPFTKKRDDSLLDGIIPPKSPNTPCLPKL